MLADGWVPRKPEPDCAVLAAFPSSSASPATLDPALRFGRGAGCRAAHVAQFRQQRNLGADHPRSTRRRRHLRPRRRCPRKRPFRRRCPLMALSRHGSHLGECPLSGVKPTSRTPFLTSVDDPKRTSIRTIMLGPCAPGRDDGLRENTCEPHGSPHLDRC